MNREKCRSGSGAVQHQRRASVRRSLLLTSKNRRAHAREWSTTERRGSTSARAICLDALTCFRPGHCAQGTVSRLIAKQKAVVVLEPDGAKPLVHVLLDVLADEYFLRTCHVPALHAERAGVVRGCRRIGKLRHCPSRKQSQTKDRQFAYGGHQSSPENRRAIAAGEHTPVLLRLQGPQPKRKPS